MKAYLANVQGEEQFIILANSLTQAKKKFKKYSISNVGTDFSNDTTFEEVTVIR